MKRTLLGSAMELMHQGKIPSISDVAVASEVSRATAYRYFPSQAAMIQEAVTEALGPILDWSSDSDDANQRVIDLLQFSYPRIEQYEATHRGALWLAMDQWARRRAGMLEGEERIVRGSRQRLLDDAIAPLRDELDADEFDKLTSALSLVFGIEALVVLKDIKGLGGDDAREVALWAARALVHYAIKESGQGRAARSNKHKAGDNPPRH